MIRRATIEDAEGIAETIVRAWKYAYEGIVDPAFVSTMKTEHFVRIMETNMRENREEIFVYEEGKLVVGFISGRFLSENDQTASYDSEVVGLYVRPERQGQGIGSKLLWKILKYFFLKKQKHVIIWTLQGANNNKFYKKHGGAPKEHKKIEIGGQNYHGVGFHFDLINLQ